MAARFASLLAELVRLAPPGGAAQPEAVAAGLWVRAFNAKKQRMGGGPHLDRLAAEVGERADRAGLRA